ncbi:MAG: Hpt domain-containing protein [Nannocystaceae bacterium]
MGLVVIRPAADPSGDSAAESELEAELELGRLRARVAALEGLTSAVADANANAAELMLELEEARDDIAERSAKLRAILDNVRAGFLVVDRSLVVGEEHTRSCSDLLHTDRVAGEKLPELLGLDGEARTLYELGIDQAFDDILPTELCLAQIGTRFKVEQRVLFVEGSAIRDEAGTVRSVLFTLTDVTEESAQREENEKRRTLIEILKGRDGFIAFLGESKRHLDTAREALMTGDKTVVRRCLHTIKGASGCYNFSEIAAIVHEVEGEREITQTHLQTVGDAIRRFLDHNFDVLDIHWDAVGENTAHSRVSADALGRLDDAARGNGISPAFVRKWVARARQQPARLVFDR